MEHSAAAVEAPRNVLGLHARCEHLSAPYDHAHDVRVLAPIQACLGSVNDRWMAIARLLSFSLGSAPSCLFLVWCHPTTRINCVGDGHCEREGLLVRDVGTIVAGSRRPRSRH